MHNSNVIVFIILWAMPIICFNINYLSVILKFSISKSTFFFPFHNLIVEWGNLNLNISVRNIIIHQLSYKTLGKSTYFLVF